MYQRSSFFSEADRYTLPCTCMPDQKKKKKWYSIFMNDDEKKEEEESIMKICLGPF